LTPLDKPPHLHELDNVPLGYVAPSPEQLVVAVQGVHGREVLTTHPHNHDGQGQHGGGYDSLFGGFEVFDEAVGDDEEDEVGVLVIEVGPGEPGGVVDDGGEMGGTCRLDVF